MSAEYILTNDPRIQSRVQARYSKDVEALTALGFRKLCFYVEQLGPLSAVLQLPMLLLMLAHREVITVQSPLRIAAGFILLYHTDPPAIALPMGMGVKIYSDFSDRTILVSCTFSNQIIPKPDSLVIRISTSKGPAETWGIHTDQVRGMERSGKVAVPQVSFNSYVDISRREEDTSQYFSPF